jgi:hypothetical protein
MAFCGGRRTVGPFGDRDEQHRGLLCSAFLPQDRRPARFAPQADKALCGWKNIRWGCQCPSTSDRWPSLDII